MKKFFLLSLLLLFFVNSFSQSYKTFPAANAYWRENKGGFQCTCCSDYQITITGDTIINLQSYHKLNSSGVRYAEDMVGNCTSTISNYFNNYVGAFREDTLNKKIFFCSTGATAEELLYDFSLIVGDTVPPTYLNSNGTYINVVQAIDSINLNGTFHKRFKIDNCNGGVSISELYFIEGVGSNYGLLHSTMCPFETIGNLICFSASGQVVYPDNSTTCSLITDINQKQLYNSISVYPSPASTILYLKSDYLIPQSITIFNNLGQAMLFKQNLTNTENINISQLKNGIYFIQIKMPNGELVNKQLIKN